MFKKLHIILLLYKYQIPLPKSPGFVLFCAPEATKWDLVGSSLTERGAEVRKNGLVFYRGFCTFFLGSVAVFVKHY